MSHRTYEEGLALVRAHRESGLSQAEYARQNRINVAGLGYWIRRVRKDQNKQAPVRFLEVTPAEKVETRSGVTIESPSGLVVRMEQEPTARFLSDLLLGFEQG